MADEKKTKIITEGIEKRGGLNKPPEKQKPSLKPKGQNPSKNTPPKGR